MSEFLSQLAQFNQADGQTNSYNTLQELVSSLQSNQALQASALVGRRVLVLSNSFTLNAKSNVSIAIDIPQGFNYLNAFVYTESGELVKTIYHQHPASGLVQFIWDGCNEEKVRMPAARYKVEVCGMKNGEKVFLKTMILANVNSVSLGERLKLNVSGVGPVLLEQVRQITV